MANWPAVDVADAGDGELALAAVDDFAPTAVEPLGDHLRLFFSTWTARDAAHAALRAAGYRAETIDVDDEDWARRSQENLKPITVGAITIAPPWHAVHPAPMHLAPCTLHPAPVHPAPVHPAPGAPFTLIIQPSMGFGTGHHATTRLCLRALQIFSPANQSVLDVGTGSGILALAAARLGAANAVGIDSDADAIHAANENVAFNPGLETVRFLVADLAVADVAAADVVLANLTGALLIRAAPRLLALLRPDGLLIVSGLLEEERDEVRRAFSGAPLAWEAREDGWVALGMKK